jgi:hypothetical protein
MHGILQCRDGYTIAEVPVIAYYTSAAGSGIIGKGYVQSIYARIKVSSALAVSLDRNQSDDA